MATPKPAPKATAPAPKASAPATVKSVTSAAAASVKQVTALAAQKGKVAPANQSAFNAGIQTLMKEEAQLAGMLGGLATAVSGGGSTAGGSPDSHFTQGGYSGTSSTGQNYIEGKPVSSAEFNTFLYGNNAGTNPSTATAATDAAAAAATRQTTVNDAFAAFKDKFTAIGLGTLADALAAKVTAPDAPTTSSGWYSALLSTPEYKARFGDTNAMRTKNGLAQLTEAQIMTAEGNIASTLRNMGMPAGFYDQPADFQQFIALDKSAQEVGDIVQAYKNIASNNVDPAIKNALQTYYGIDLGGVTAMLMDPTKAQPILDAITQKGTTAAAAAGAGITDIAGAAQVAGGLGAGTMTYAKQADAFAQSQLLAQQATPLSNIYAQQLGTTYSSAQSMQEAFGGPQSVQAAEQRKKLTNLETSTFGGSAGASQQGQSLGIANQQGVQ